MHFGSSERLITLINKKILITYRQYIKFQVRMLREQLNEEVKRRQLYIMRTSRTGQEMQHLRHALSDSLRAVSQEPSLDAGMLEHEARKLDSTLSSSLSLPPALGRTSTPRFTVRSPTPTNK